MRKNLFVILLIAGVAFAAFAQNGVVRELSGDVTLKSTKSSAFVPARSGDTVAIDTIVSTGFKSTAVIEVGSSTITVRPLTRLSLAEIQSTSSSETLNVNLQAGRIKVDVKPPAGTKASTVVRGPSSTASVRGTSFEFDTYNLTVSEGTVALQGNNGMVMLVPAGTVSYVDSDGQAADPIVTTQEALTPSAPVGTGVAAEAPVQAAPSSSFGRGNIDLTIKW